MTEKQQSDTKTGETESAPPERRVRIDGGLINEMDPDPRSVYKPRRPTFVTEEVTAQKPEGQTG